MAQTGAEHRSFVVQIVNTQNSEWQGTVTWTDGKESKPFRSMLELLGLIESTLHLDAPEQ